MDAIIQHVQSQIQNRWTKQRWERKKGGRKVLGTSTSTVTFDGAPVWGSLTPHWGNNKDRE